MSIEEDFNTRALSMAFSVANPGRVLEANLIPIINRGKLRIHYNWLYSALNCDPNNHSSFPWVFHKLANGKVALSPKNGYSGMTLYASVRPDWYYYTQVQAPHSAQWIEAVGGDEELTIAELGLLTVNFKGLNGKYLQVNNNITTHDRISGYKLQCNGDVAGPPTNMFVAVIQTLQSHLQIPTIHDISQAQVQSILEANDAQDPKELAEEIFAS